MRALEWVDVCVASQASRAAHPTVLHAAGIAGMAPRKAHGSPCTQPHRPSLQAECDQRCCTAPGPPPKSQAARSSVSPMHHPSSLTLHAGVVI